MGFFREVLFQIIRFFVNILTFFIFPIKIIHKKRIPKRSKYISVSNHLSWVDMLYVHLRTPGRRYVVAKKELWDNSRTVRIFGKIFGGIAIDRDNPSISSIKQILTFLKRNLPISLFPEGTRNKENRELQELKQGAAVFAIKGAAPMIPILIYSKARAFRKNYIYIGELFDFSEYYGVRMNEELTAAAEEKMRTHMLLEMEKMDDYIVNKRWKKKNRLLA